MRLRDVCLCAVFLVLGVLVHGQESRGTIRGEAVDYRL